MLTKFQTYRKMGEAYGSWYWSQPGKFAEKDKAARVALILEYRRYRKALAQGDYTVERNPRGNIVWRDADADFRATGRNRHGENRYFYDFGPLKTWKQYDTRSDASYFGVWVDIEGMRTFTYAEGDRTLVECETLEAFKAELDDMASFYGEPPPAFLAIDHDGTKTEIYCERPSVEAAHA